MTNHGGRAIFNTVAFRVAAVYALIYAVLTAGVLAIILVATHDQIRAQIRAGIHSESTLLATLYQSRGSMALMDTVMRKSNAVFRPGDRDADDAGSRFYALIGPTRRLLAGNISHWPIHAPKSGWINFRDHAGGPQLVGLIRPLPGGYSVLVGQSLAIPNGLDSSFILWGSLASVLMLTAGLVGGATTGRIVMRRIERASLTAEHIRGGRLGERLDTTESGEYAVLAEAFNDMLARIEAAVLGLRDLGARMAHEIKSPIARTMRALERASVSTEPQSEIARAQEILLELNRRVEALLRLAHLEGGASKEFFADFRLDRLVADVAELYQPMAEEAGQRILVHSTAGDTSRGDRQLLAQALVNLVENALRYAPRNATITISESILEQQAILEVHDTGAGPSARPAKNAGGVGLGLAITRAIVHLHEGELQLDKGGKGFTARLRIPISPFS